MKKLLSLILALALIFSLSLTAFATEVDGGEDPETVDLEDTTVTIENSDGKTYKAIKLLNLTSSLKSASLHPAHENGSEEHTSSCYNYAYTVNPKYRTYLKKETFENGGNYLWDATNPKPASYEGITDDQILKYLANQTSDAGDVYHTMRTVADRLYRAIKADVDAGTLDFDVKEMSGKAKLEQGYWMIVDVTANDGFAANSLVMVDTKGLDALTIKPKTSLPSVEKKVRDINDSDDGSLNDNAWLDTADHDLGSEVPFKLTATLASNYFVYDAYALTFHDSLSAGLTPVTNAEGKLDYQVYMYESKYVAENDLTLTNERKVDVTEYFHLEDTADLCGENGCSFEIYCNNVKNIPGVTANSAFLVFYSAKVNENAVIGADGNSNKVQLEFSNDPYSDSTGRTDFDEVKVYTFKLIINKVDDHGHALEGAEFQLYKKSYETGNYEEVSAAQFSKNEEGTVFTWERLDDGDYKLVETVVPDGYNQMNDALFTISATHGGENSLELTSLSAGAMGEGDLLTATITNNIINKTGTVLPETGAEGTFLLLTCSAVVVMIAVVFMVTRKRMSIYED